MVGFNYCVYGSSEGRGRHYPIVRQFSFRYPDVGLLKVDHHNLKEYLGELKGAKGVILDLRDNRGGNNPNWFLDWWAPRPYYDHFVHTRLHEDFDSVEKLERAGITGWGPARFQTYLSALEQRTDDTAFMEPRPFFCPTPDCENWDNRYEPKNQVTTLPVALLVGPRCVSSCDHVVYVFKENEFGPVIGTPGAAGFTAYRLKYDVKHPVSGENLGSVNFAFSYEVSGKTREKVEAVVVEPDVMIGPTFENQGRYDRLLVGAAIEALGRP
jgi:hypothetical protein